MSSGVSMSETPASMSPPVQLMPVRMTDAPKLSTLNATLIDAY